MWKWDAEAGMSGDNIDMRTYNEWDEQRQQRQWGHSLTTIPAPIKAVTPSCPGDSHGSVARRELPLILYHCLINNNVCLILGPQAPCQRIQPTGDQKYTPTTTKCSLHQTLTGPCLDCLVKDFHNIHNVLVLINHLDVLLSVKRIARLHTVPHEHLRAWVPLTSRHPASAETGDRWFAVLSLWPKTRLSTSKAIPFPFFSPERLGGESTAMGCQTLGCFG